MLAALPGAGDEAKAVINGLFGDTLTEQGSRLAIGMTLRTAAGVEVALDRDAIAGSFPDAGHRVCVLVHGLMSTESIWRFPGDRHRSYGSILAGRFGVTPVYVRYNTGHHISTNGRELADLLQAVVREWPVRVREIDLVGHSMGGLVIRSACHYGGHRVPWTDRLRGRGAWTKRVRRVVLLGVPNGGARLEVIANLTSAALRSTPIGVTRLLGAGLDRRSDGIKDLRWGSVLDEDWQDRDPGGTDQPERAPVRIPRRARILAVAGSIAHDPDGGVHPANRVLGDALVSAASAHGSVGSDIALFPNASVRLLPRLHHIALAHRAEVADEIVAWWRPLAHRTRGVRSR